MSENQNIAQNAALQGPSPTGGAVGVIVRRERSRLGLTLQQLADRVACAKSYLWAIENDIRGTGAGGRTSEKLLGKLEQSLGLTPGTLVEAARWQQTPATIRRQVADLQHARRAAEVLKDAIKNAGPRGLDELHKSGVLTRLIGQISPPQADNSGGRASAVPIALPVEIPLINSVAAGYPREFTDLGYPARIADQYVRSPDIADADAFAARVVGDSMEPAYREGDIVVFAPNRPVRGGMDCFIRLERDQETTFKRVFFETDAEGGEQIRLQPLNAAYPPRVFPREDVSGLYPAVSVMRTIE